jgi:hypothetical protein
MDQSEWDLLVKEKRILPTVIVKMMMASKLARQAFKHKRDNLVDLAGYTGLLSILEESPVDLDDTVSFGGPEQLVDFGNPTVEEITPTMVCTWKLYRVDKPVMKDVETITDCFSEAFKNAVHLAYISKEKIIFVEFDGRINLTIYPDGSVRHGQDNNPLWVMGEAQRLLSEVSHG